MENVVGVLQASFAPCVLVSGLGLLLLTMSNRLSRPIDRIRQLCRELETTSDKEIPSLQEQIRILYKQCRLLRASIAFITISIFFAATIIFLLFFSYRFGIHLEFLVEAAFAASLISLIASLVFFLLDIRLSLNSVKMEIERHLV
ncbi:MAG: DUF2721 domain-containing protein [Candidatus Omnitrophota bacterium]